MLLTCLALVPPLALSPLCKQWCRALTTVYWLRLQTRAWGGSGLWMLTLLCRTGCFSFWFKCFEINIRISSPQNWTELNFGFWEHKSSILLCFPKVDPPPPGASTGKSHVVRNWFFHCCILSNTEQRWHFITMSRLVSFQVSLIQVCDSHVSHVNEDAHLPRYYRAHIVRQLKGSSMAKQRGFHIFSNFDDVRTCKVFPPCAHCCSPLAVIFWLTLETRAWVSGSGL